MTCPKCNGKMETTAADGVEVDRCTGCGGIWFDLREDEQLKQKAATIDTKRPTESAGQAGDSTKIDCPRCKTRMITMTVLNQPHIKYECCSICFGRFFDAGEFKDAATRSFSDFLQRLKM